MSFKKCKYCGGKKIRFYENDTFGTREPSYEVWCEDCRNRTKKYASRDAAFNAWNKENSK